MLLSNTMFMFALFVKGFSLKIKFIHSVKFYYMYLHLPLCILCVTIIVVINFTNLQVAQNFFLFIPDLMMFTSNQRICTVFCYVPLSGALFCFKELNTTNVRLSSAGQLFFLHTYFAFSSFKLKIKNET